MALEHPQPPVGMPAGVRHQPPASPLLGRLWLARWRALGGNVTIGKTGLLAPWRLPPEPDLNAISAAQLLDDFMTTIGMRAAVHAVLRAEALMRTAGARKDPQ